MKRVQSGPSARSLCVLQSDGSSLSLKLWDASKCKVYSMARLELILPI